jgi:hypothetical protein
LLSERLSEGGPGITWYDIDRDGWDDLLIGSGKGGQLAVYRNDQRGGFTRVSDAPFTNPVPRDLTTVLGWSPDGIAATLLAGLSNAEEGAVTNAAVRVYNLRSRSIQDALGRQVASTGPLALGDIDGDGHLECFVGARLLPNRYPEPVTSRLYQNIGGQLRLNPNATKALERVGIVTAAVFTDLTGSGHPDLVLACDWGAVRVFRAVLALEGRVTPSLKEVTHDLGLDKYLGRWNGVTAGDIDGDGRMDIIASNWGRNTKYQRYLDRPLRMLHGDLLGDGTVQTIEAFFDQQHRKWFPWRDLETMSSVFPPIRARFDSFRVYGAASVEEIFKEVLPAMMEYRANTLDSMVFLNRANGFEAHPLPIETQFAPAFGLTVADFDGDSREDLFLAQNFFATELETPRYDAGRGLLLLNTGGTTSTNPLTPTGVASYTSPLFSAMPGQKSGIHIYGQQRGCAVADYNGDGRLDLAVGQNGGPTKLYKNVNARPGLRVRLKGPPSNDSAVGAVIRPIYNGRQGPAREIHAGSGYWSQDSAVQVVALESAGVPLTELFVRWPAGKTTTTPVPPRAAELTVDATGAAQKP